MLSTVQTMGHVTKDPVLKAGTHTGHKYLRLNLAADSGYGENKKSVFYQATFFGNEAERIIKAKIKKGSFIELAGNIEEVITFQPDGSEEIMAMIKVEPYRWSFVPTFKKEGATAIAQEAPAQAGAIQANPADFPEVECGVDDELPV